MYPPNARYEGIQGTVNILVTIGSGGKLEEARVMKGSPILAQALDCVAKRTFRSSMLNGTATRAAADHDIVFKLR